MPPLTTATTEPSTRSRPSSAAWNAIAAIAQRARRLDDEPAPLGGQPDAGGDLGLGDGHDRIEVRAQVRERPGAERLRPRPVGDRPRHELGRPADDLAALERVARVGGQLRFDADDADARPEAP